MIRELTADEVRAHADELAQLLLDAHASGMALGLAGPLTTDRARRAYLETADALRPDERMLLAAFDGDVVIGAVQLDRAGGNGRHRAELRRLAVRADHRGTGLGRALMDAAVERARAAGLGLLWLSTHVDTFAEAFYERLGWTRAGGFPNWAETPDGRIAANSLWYLELQARE